MYKTYAYNGFVIKVNPYAGLNIRITPSVSSVIASSAGKILQYGLKENDEFFVDLIGDQFPTTTMTNIKEGWKNYSERSSI